MRGVPFADWKADRVAFLVYLLLPCGSPEFLNSWRTSNLNLNFVSLAKFYVVVVTFTRRGSVCVCAWTPKEDVKQSVAGTGESGADSWHLLGF